MIKWIETGGAFFMVPLILMLCCALILAVWQTIKISSGSKVPTKWVRHIGTFALGFGVLGQCIGLYSAFIAIEEWGSVSPEVLYAGIGVSSITTITGLVIFLLCYLMWFALEFFSNQQTNRK